MPIELIFDQSPNDLFVIRVAGNVLGVECLGSIDYAVANLGKSLKLVVVWGTRLVVRSVRPSTRILTPKNYAEIAFTHALRSLIDRIQTAVRGAAPVLSSAWAAASIETRSRISRRADRNGRLPECGRSPPMTCAARSPFPPASETRVVYSVLRPGRAAACGRIPAKTRRFSPKCLADRRL